MLLVVLSPPDLKTLTPSFYPGYTCLSEGPGLRVSDSRVATVLFVQGHHWFTTATIPSPTSRVTHYDFCTLWDVEEDEVGGESRLDD